LGIFIGEETVLSLRLKAEAEAVLTGFVVD
jgi:hypothetical protein